MQLTVIVVSVINRTAQIESDTIKTLSTSWAHGKTNKTVPSLFPVQTIIYASTFSKARAGSNIIFNP